MDSSDIDIDFTYEPIDRRRKKRNGKNYNWRYNAEQHSARAIEVAERFFNSLDLSNTTEEQDDILKYSSLTGTYYASGERTLDLSPGHHMHEFQALESIEADEGWVEELILEVMQNGLINISGFINSPARQWKGNYLYKHVEKLLDIHDSFIPNEEYSLSEFEYYSTGIIDLWLENISTEDYETLVWYNSTRKNIRQLFGSIDKQEKRTVVRGGTPYSFRDFWDYYYIQQNETAQDVVDHWEKAYINWNASGFYFGGGRKKNKFLTLKR